MKFQEIKNQLQKLWPFVFSRGGHLISYLEAKQLLKENPMAVLVDVRSIQEYKEYHLEGAICIPEYELFQKIETILQDKDQMIILYCQSGARSKKAANLLQKMGYQTIYEIEKGLNDI